MLDVAQDFFRRLGGTHAVGAGRTWIDFGLLRAEFGQIWIGVDKSWTAFRPTSAESAQVAAEFDQLWTDLDQYSTGIDQVWTDIEQIRTELGQICPTSAQSGRLRPTLGRCRIDLELGQCLAF